GDLTLSHPRHQLGAGARYGWERVTTHLTLQHVAGLYAADFGQNRLPDYTVVDARVAVAVTPGVSLDLAAHNLLDEQYQVMPGYPMPERQASLGVRVPGR
ncbi:MAG: hypothetical protein ACLFRX_11540, partial [Gemmatimonadota bacterium]